MIAVFRHHVSAYALLSVLLDLVLAFAGIQLAAWTIYAYGAYDWETLPDPGTLLKVGLAFAVLTSLVSACFGTYRKPARNGSSALARALVALPIAGYVGYLSVKLIVDIEHTAAVTGLALLYLGTGLVFTRTGSRYLRRWTTPSKVLIVGTGPEAQALAAEIGKQSRSTCEVVGFYPTNEQTQDAVPPGLSGVFSRQRRLLDLVAEHDVREVIVAATEQRGGGVPMDQLLACRTRGVLVLDLAGYYERSRSEVPLDSLKASWLVYGSGFVQGRMRRLIKRSFDIVGSSLLLIASLPVLALAMVLVALDSPGPVIYRQERVGFRGRTFMCLKLRSMRTDAESDGVERWASTDDPRVTRIGRFIRKTRIDELPQLVSVLRGEMSLVGPRPERPSFVRDLTEQIPFYDIRHTIKPGLTGWAQVRYNYGCSLADAKRKHQFDLYYVKNNSLFLDLLILIETVSVVLLREGQ